MASKRSSVAASVVRQHADKAAKSNNVVPISGDFPKATRIETGFDAVGQKIALRATLPDYANASSTYYDLSFMIAFPNIEKAFSSAFLHRAIKMRHNSRVELRGNLIRGLYSFLKTNYTKAFCLNDFTSDMFVALVSWLNAPRKDGQPLAPQTRGAILSAIRGVLETMCESPERAKEAQIARQNIPTNPWPGIAKRSVPRDRLDRDHLKAIIDAAEKECLKIKDRFNEGRRLLAAGREALRNGAFDRHDLGTCLARLDALYPEMIPGMDVIWKDDPVLASDLQYKHGYGRCTDFFYASSADLVPFALLIASATAFNADTVLSLGWSGIVEIERFGLPAIQITGPKGRAATDPTILLDGSVADGMGLMLLLGLLREVTSRIRPSIQPISHRDLVFIYVPRWGGDRMPKGLGRNTGRPSNDAVWSKNMRDFIESNSLASFTLSQLRPTILDEITLVTGDLMAARAVGQQRQLQTLWQHYTSAGTRDRFYERIGEYLMLRERWQDTNGLIDPRARASSHDKGAATPGFLCFDPMESPRPNQQRGRLCSAYGECPSCPFAAVNVGDPAVVALLLALENAIFLAQGPIAPKAWLARWAPILADLRALLLHVPDAVLKQANRYVLKLSMPVVG